MKNKNKKITKEKKNKKRRKTFVFLLIAAGVVLILSLIFNQIVVSSSEKYILSYDDALSYDADCIIVLGAKVSGEALSHMLSDRMDIGIELYRDHTAPKLLLSGDHGTDDYDEVNAMMSYAVDEGVPADDIFLDHAGFCTYDSIFRAKAVFQAEKVIIVTQGYHLYRAVYIARSLGLDAWGVASDQRTYVGQFQRDIREYIARDKDLLSCLFKPDPKFLGEVIPISGSGTPTHDKLS